MIVLHYSKSHSAILYCFVLYLRDCFVLSCVVFYFLGFHCFWPFYSVLNFVELNYIILYCNILKRIVLHCFVLYWMIVSYCISLDFTALYCIVLYCIALYRIAFHVILGCFLKYTFHTVLKVNVLFDSLLPDSNDPHSHKIV